MRVAIACLRPFQKLPHLLELLQQPVDFLYGPPRALRDPQPPRSAEDRRIGPLVGRHGQHDCLDVLRRLSSALTALSACAFTPGNRPSTCLIGPIACICFSATRKSARSIPRFERALRSRRCAASASMVAAAFSTKATTSPWPRIRPATCTGLNGSSASGFSPTPTYLIGTPVTP